MQYNVHIHILQMVLAWPLRKEKYEKKKEKKNMYLLSLVYQFA